YRTQNAGKSWEPLTRGLPQKNAMETILRDSLATDTCDPAGIYFGTRSGKVYGSNDEGKTWQAIIEGLPAVVCVKAALVGDGGTASPRRRGGAEKKRAGKTRSGVTKRVSARKTASTSRARAAKR
ncbi:MAG: WD40/YVTN/BNR-like repeat-containing protein, partial [Candidatus Angelobacter sp.]